jgi:hypothetical protein
LQKVERLYDNYTPAALEDELTFLLASKNECNIILNEEGWLHIHVFHPYLIQAEGLLYKINIYRPLPKFVIWVNDVPLGLANALELEQKQHLGNGLISEIPGHVRAGVNCHFKRRR